MKAVTSRRNAIVARYRAVARGEEPGLLLDGPHLVDEALRAKVRLLSAVISSASLDRPEIRGLADRLGRADVEVLSASAAVMSAVSPVRSSSVIAAIAEPRAVSPAAPYGGRSPLVLIACDVQDPGNLGAIVRVAEAGGATGVVAAGTSADPFGWKAMRGSMGSALRLPIVRTAAVADAIAEAKRHRCRVVAATPRDGRTFAEANLAGPLAVLIGSEGSGLSTDAAAAADERVSIPMNGPVESLNAAVTAALLVYEARRQRESTR